MPEFNKVEGGAGLALSGIYVFPIKSCRGISLPRALVESAGLALDREWMIVDEKGRFVTQREEPRLAGVDVAIEGEALVLGFAKHASLHIPLGGQVESMLRVSIWGRESAAVDQGEEASKWFSAVLKRSVKLVRLPRSAALPVVSEFFSGKALTRFTDGFPFLLISESSLAKLNEQLDRKLPMERFRPNLVVSGAGPHAEDEWRRIRVGSMCFRVCKPCPRCVIPTIDPETFEKDKEPLARLATYRRSELGVIFGQNLVHEGTGTLTLGDEIEVLEEGGAADESA